MKTERIRCAVVGLVLTFLSFTCAAQPSNLLVNGSFESPGFQGAVMELAPGSTQITGWVTGQRGADWLSSAFLYAYPADGSFYVDLSGAVDDPSGGGGSIWQAVPTIPGLTYQLSFSMSGENANVSAPAQLAVNIGATVYNFSVPTADPIVWTRQTITFTAQSNSTVIGFADAGPLNAGNNNPLLDLVSLTILFDPHMMETLVPCAGPSSGGVWKNHGEYLGAVRDVVGSLLDMAVIQKDDAQAILAAARKSGCGK
jgi:hypothetical protein